MRFVRFVKERIRRWLQSLWRQKSTVIARRAEEPGSYTLPPAVRPAATSRNVRIATAHEYHVRGSKPEHQTACTDTPRVWITHTNIRDIKYNFKWGDSVIKAIASDRLVISSWIALTWHSLLWQDVNTRSVTELCNCYGNFCWPVCADRCAQWKCTFVPGTCFPPFGTRLSATLLDT